MEVRLYDLCAEAANYVDTGQHPDPVRPRPRPRAGGHPVAAGVAAVHQHLVREGPGRSGLVIESGEPREIHHLATLIGYGAAAINPYLMFESLDELARRLLLAGGARRRRGRGQHRQGDRQGAPEDISKMGISTIQSYCGAQIFEAIGLTATVIDSFFTGTPPGSGASGWSSSPPR